MGTVEGKAVKAKINKELTSAKLTRRQALTLICQDNADHLEDICQIHPGTMTIALRLAEYIGDLLPVGESNLLDMTLADALTSWDSVYDAKGSKEAYYAFCSVVRDALPRVFDYRVSGKRRMTPYNTSIWDCVGQSVYDWIRESQVIKVEVDCNSMNSLMSHRELSIMLTPRVFSRIDMMQWGLPPEGRMEVISERFVVVEG